MPRNAFDEGLYCISMVTKLSSKKLIVSIAH